MPPARRSQFLAPLAARLGAIVKGGTHQETLGRLDTVVLDKTGTLTFGRPEVQRIAPVAGVRDTELLDAAATTELHSPLGEAIVAYAHRLGREVAELAFAPASCSGSSAMI